MEAIELVRSFIKERLDGDIERLSTFELGNLRGDDIYGCPNRNFDSDDTELMRAIYCIVFADAWEHISMDNLGEGKLRGDTMNSYNTLFSPTWKERFSEIWNPDKELVAKIRKYHKICYTIGNMTILPDKRIGEWSINKHRGCHDEWHDYEDRFLAALHKVLTQQADRDPDLEELVKLNEEDFRPLYGVEGWRSFIEKNRLEYYVGDDYVPMVKSLGYTYWRGGYTNRERFFSECHRYIDDSTQIINNRAKRMIEILNEQL